MSTEENAPAVGRASRRVTWLVVAIVTLLVGGIVGALWYASTDAADHDFKNVVTGGGLAGYVLFLGAWFFWRSRISTKWKWGATAMFLLGVVALCVEFRIEDVTGDMRFRVVRRRAPERDALLKIPEQLVAGSRAPERDAGKGESTGEESAKGADLTATTPYDFPQFLGRGRDGVVHGVRLAADWDKNKNSPKQIWRQPIGAGWSGFAVVGPYAVTQEQRGDQELAVCYEWRTGKLVWVHADPVRFGSVLGGDGPRATPTIDEGRVYVQGATGLLSCLDGRTGEVVWTRDIIAENGAENIAWGRSGSPLVAGDKVLVSAGGPNGKSLVAYHKQTGEPIWKNGSDVASYASPVLATLGGIEQVLTVNQDFAVGHALEDGRELWRISWPGKSDSNANTSQPVALPGDRVFLSKGYGSGSALLELKPDGERFNAAVVWNNASLLKTKMTNVVIHDGHLYGLSGGILECVELETGKRRWKGGRYGHGQVLLVGEHLLVSAESGEVALVAASPERLEELGRFEAIEGVTWNYPALVGPHLLIRNHQEAACYELPLASE